MQSIRFARQKFDLTPAQCEALGMSASPIRDEVDSVVDKPAAPVANTEKNSKTENPFIVTLSNAEQPQNWPLPKKWLVVLGLSQIAIVVTFASSVFAPAYDLFSEDFDIVLEVAVLPTSVFLVGLGVGGLLMGPLSEMLGIPYLMGMFFFSIFHIGAAAAQNWYTVVICRLIAGIFGATPLSNAGGSLADMCSPTLRTLTFPTFAAAGFIAPTIGPVVGSFIVSSPGGWRFTLYICAFWGFAVFAMAFFFLPETYVPALVEAKAAALNKEYKTDKFISPRFAQTGKRATFNWRQLPRAMRMVAMEPIVFLMTLYLTIAYFILYSELESFTLIYSQWNFTLNQTGLVFLALTVGVIITWLSTPIVYLDFQKRIKRINGHMIHIRTGEDKIVRSPPPEARLVQLCYACWLLPISMFWLGFTTFPSISPWPSIVASIPFGCSLLFIFISAYAYVIDVYAANSASALAALTFVRYVVSGGVIHASTPMFEKLTLRGGYSLLGGVGLAMCLVPFALIRWGPGIRRRSTYAPPKEDEADLGPIVLL